MDFLPDDIDHYCSEHTSSENELLKHINRDTNMNVLMPRMVSGHFQGRVLSMISKMISPLNILEIGTYTGYSGLCLAEGLKENGKLVTIDINEELEERVRDHFSKSSYDSQIEYVIGNAIEVLPRVDLNFDLVFIDADKDNYLNYYHLIFDKLNKGGVIIADNVLWSGKVIEERRKKLDRDTQAIIEFNHFVQNDDRVENVLFPIRDGLMVLRKK